jgi:hypothetical protein
MVNRFAGRCCYCRASVPPSGGRCWRWRGRWYVAHTECSAEAREARKEGRAPERRVDTFVIGGKEFTRNARGRCEDAPCCGCCTI